MSINVGDFVIASIGNDYISGNVYAIWDELCDEFRLTVYSVEDEKGRCMTTPYVIKLATKDSGVEASYRNNPPKKGREKIK